MKSYSNNTSEFLNQKVSFPPPFSDFNSGRITIYKFIITRFEIFTSKSGQDFLKFIFHLSNENETFEEDQVFLLNSDGSLSSRLEEFIDQFAQFYDLKDDITFEDFIGERGTCYIDMYKFNGRTYRKIIITAMEDEDHE